MEVFDKKPTLNNFVTTSKQSGKTIGFVPTMGALHEGHLSLIDNAKKQCDIAICSIFVNPTQFNDKGDYDRYPRVLESDLEMLRSVNCNAVFTPSELEMYPEKDTRVFDMGGLDARMEGAFRPGHFNGMLQIVTKLLDAVKPHKAFFGQKDFQQLAIVKHIVKQQKIPVEIIACPTLREPDGLAMSSRNRLLSDEERAIAPLIYETLSKLKNDIHILSVEELCKRAVAELSTQSQFKIEYLEIVDTQTLQPVKEITSKTRAIVCTAVKLGKVRLIDNLILL